MLTTPDVRKVVEALSYKPGWSFKIAGPYQGYLCIYATTPDSLNPDTTRVTQHQFELPTDVTLREFLRWVLDCCLTAEFHEACEFLALDGFRPFFPNHQGDGSPYELVERWETNDPLNPERRFG